MNAAPRPRVLLVEDDASLRRFVALALDEFDIELLAVPSVDDGLAELARAPADVVMTDLMLPGRSGFELIEALAGDAALRGSARLIVFSAGLTPQIRQRLERPAVWRLLSKPCSVAELVTCVHEALHDAPGAGAPTAAGAEPAAEPPAAVAANFGGDLALYRAFRAQCLQQFAHDRADGERAEAQGDIAALRRLAHSLKSVLQLLGEDPASALAHDLERCCERHDGAGAAAGWRALDGALAGLR